VPHRLPSESRRPLAPGVTCQRYNHPLWFRHEVAQTELPRACNSSGCHRNFVWLPAGQPVPKLPLLSVCVIRVVFAIVGILLVCLGWISDAERNGDRRW
jgi:hypothetical protein